MIRFIAALDKKMGIADDQGIPWLGLLPLDEKYFRDKTLGGTLLMGYGEYLKKKRPFSERRNLVATTRDIRLREGFEKISDARKFLSSTTEDIWVSGGAGLYTSTLDLADELYLTQIDYDFDCTKFFPDYQELFKLHFKSKSYLENEISYHFEIWRKLT
jgi:dihydrofolate reductase